MGTALSKPNIIDVKQNIINKTKNNSELSFQVNDNNLLTNNQKLSNPSGFYKKKFISNYNCGSNSKNKRINALLYQRVKYDCKVENDSCKSKLQLEDNGTLTLYSGNNFQNIKWRRQYKNGVPNNERKASVGKYKRNYLLQGETLEPGEFIGSPNGTCFLILEKNPYYYNRYNRYNLVIKYKKYHCPWWSNNINLYDVEQIDRKDMNKLAFITEGGRKKMYPDDITTLSNNYFNLGNYYSYAKNIHISYAKLDDCKKKCNEKNNCYGFSHYNKKWCYLKGKDIYPVNPTRMYHNKFDLYLRKKQPNNNVDCPKDVIGIDQKTYNTITKNSNINPNYTCNFNDKLSELKKNKDKADNNLTKRATKLIENFIDSKEGMQNFNKLYKSLNYNNNKYSNYINSNTKNIYDLSNIKLNIDNIIDKIPSVEGQLEDLEKNFNSEHYFYILLSIISIIFIIISIKMANS